MPKPFCLVHIVTKLELGGAQLATLHQVAHLDFGARPHHLIFGPGGMLDAAAYALGDVVCWPVAALYGPVHVARDGRAVLAIATVLRRIAAQHPGHKLLVHTHSSKAGIVGRWAAALVGAECIVHTIHGFGHQPHMGAAQFCALWAAERLARQVTSGFTADSQANLDRGRQEGLLGKTPSCVVRCGIDLSAYTDAAAPAGLRASLGIDAAHAIVLSVACLKPQKDPLTWVRVAAIVLRQRPQTTFVLAGDGVLRPEVVAAIESAGIAVHCRLLGWRRDIPELMRLCDLVLHTSLWEGLPQVFAQTMASAKPLVATQVDGAQEAIEPNVTGLLRPARDAPGLAQDVVALLADPKRGRRLGQMGQRRAAAFSENKMRTDLQAFYNKLTEC